MRDDFYPEGTVRELLKTSLVTPVTKQVLNDRLSKDTVLKSDYFGKELFETLQAVCRRLIPQPSRKNMVDLPGLLEEQLINKSGNGWRYASMPDDNEALFSGLRGIEQAAVLHFGQSFHQLAPSEQDVLLQSIQDGTSTAPIFINLSSSLFFEELLARLVELYYSHPFAKEEIGDASFADATGWAKLKLNKIEDYESAPVKTSDDQ